MTIGSKVIVKQLIKSNVLKKIAVIGAGSWGTSLAILLAKNGHSTKLWGHKYHHVEELIKDRENKKYLQGILFPEKLLPVSDLDSAVQSANVVVMAVPSHALRDIFTKVSPFLEDNCRLISAVKGVENETLLTMSQVMQDVLDKSSKVIKGVEIGVLSGPSFAQEVALEFPTAVTLGFKEIQFAIEMQKLFVNDYFRVYASRDVLGIEICAALKNVIAIAAGVCEGLGYGLNTRAALITRGLAEMRRLGRRLNTDDTTFSGLSGIGDLILTCTGDLSRNRRVGIQLGKGKKLKEIVDEMCMVAEGVKNTKSMHDLAKKLDIEMPILEQVYQIVHKNKKCDLAVHDLLKRELKVE